MKGMFKRKGDVYGVRNFVSQEVEDFKTSKGVKAKAKSLVQTAGDVANRVATIPSRMKYGNESVNSAMKEIKSYKKGFNNFK
jgi:hypothetical protein